VTHQDQPTALPVDRCTYGRVGSCCVQQNRLGRHGRCRARGKRERPRRHPCPQALREGDVVMIDGGAECGGDVSDINRTVVFGEPSARQIDVRNEEPAVQTAAVLAGLNPRPHEEARRATSCSPTTTLPSCCLFRAATPGNLEQPAAPRGK
jgi:methionine aminopeptidase